MFQESQMDLQTVVKSNERGERVIPPEFQPVLDKYLKQKLWNILVKHVRHNFSQAAELSVFDPTAGKDRDTVQLTDSAHLTLGNVYPQAGFDDELK
jgi:hypothetical protein